MGVIHRFERFVDDLNRQHRIVHPDFPRIGIKGGSTGSKRIRHANERLIERDIDLKKVGTIYRYILERRQFEVTHQVLTNGRFEFGVSYKGIRMIFKATKTDRNEIHVYPITAFINGYVKDVDFIYFI